MLTAKEQKSLVERAKRGDGEAMEMLVRAYLSAAYAVALAVVGRPSDAEDIAQDAFIRALERIETCRDAARFGGWFLQIVRNQAKNHLSWRRLRDVPRDIEPKETVDHRSSAERLGLKAALLGALETLSPVQREVVLLHDLEGWTHPEIAEVLGISVVMSRQHLFQSRRLVRATLEDKNKEVRGAS